MSLFGSFNPVKAITRAVGIPDKVSRVIQFATLPLTAPTNLALQAGGRILQQVGPGAPSQGVQQIHENVPQPIGSGNVLQPAGPSYVYYAGGGGYSPTAGGYSPWDFSTPSIPSFQPQYPTYPAYSVAAPAPADRTWEDLILASAAFL